jgi:hypothetical protein
MKKRPTFGNVVSSPGAACPATTAPAPPPDPGVPSGTAAELLADLFLRGALDELVRLHRHHLAWIAPPVASDPPELGWYFHWRGSAGWSEAPLSAPSLAWEVCAAIAARPRPAPAAALEALAAHLRRGDDPATIIAALGEDAAVLALAALSAFGQAAPAPVAKGRRRGRPREGRETEEALLALARRDVRLRGWADGLPDEAHRPGWHKLRDWDGSFTTAAWEPRTGTWTVYDLAAGAFTVPVAAPHMWRRLGFAYVGPCLPPVLAEGERPASFAGVQAL